MQIFQNKIAVARRVHAVQGGTRECKFLSSNCAVELQRRTCYGAGSQRTKIETIATIQQAGDIPQQHFHICLQPMRNQHRLSALQMRIGGHHRFACRVRLLGQGRRPLCQLARENSNAFPDVQSKVRSDLFITAPPCMQLQSKITDACDQLHLNEVMNVLCSCVVADLSVLLGIPELLLHAVERVAYRSQLQWSEDRGCTQGPSMRLTGSHLLGK